MLRCCVQLHPPQDLPTDRLVSVLSPCGSDTQRCASSLSSKRPSMQHSAARTPPIYRSIAAGKHSYLVAGFLETDA